MNAAHHFTDEELTAFLDGEADPKTFAAIEAALLLDQNLAARLDGLRIPIGDIRQGFDGLLASAPKMTFETEPSTPSAMKYAPWAACLALGLALGFGLSSRSGAPEADWMDYVASYQALYVSDTLAIADLSAPEQEEQLGALTGALGRDVSNAAAVPNLRFKRGQLLGYQGQPLVQLAYLSPEGLPVALCIIRSDKAAQEISTSELEGMKTASWRDGEFEYLLIGSQDPTLILTAAQHFATNL